MQASDVRDHNLATVLGAILDSREPLSRAGVAQVTGLTKPTVAKVVEDLQRGQLIDDGVPASPSGAGRPATPLQIHESGPIGIGLELAADHVSCLVTDLAGEVLAHRRNFGSFTASSADEAAAALAAVLAETAPNAGRPIAGICVSVPGRITPEGQCVLSAPNLAWVDVALVDSLCSALGARDLDATLRLANDGHLAAASELRLRPGQSFLFIHGGTGVGGGIAVDGVLLSGSNGWAGEIGHVNVEAEGKQCRCGRRGCLEAQIGYHALRESAGLDEGVHIEDVVVALADRLGERDAVMAQIGTHLGRAIGAAMNLLDVGQVVLSGYLAPIVEELRAPIEAELARVALATEGLGITLEPALGQVSADSGTPSAALTGAATTALRAIIGDPATWLSGSRKISLRAPSRGRLGRGRVSDQSR